MHANVDLGPLNKLRFTYNCNAIRFLRHISKLLIHDTGTFGLGLHTLMSQGFTIAFEVRRRCL